LCSEEQRVAVNCLRHTDVCSPATGVQSISSCRQGHDQSVSLVSEGRCVAVYLFASHRRLQPATAFSQSVRIDEDTASQSVRVDEDTFVTGTCSRHSDVFSSSDSHSCQWRTRQRKLISQSRSTVRRRITVRVTPTSTVRQRHSVSQPVSTKDTASQSVRVDEDTTCQPIVEDSALRPTACVTSTSAVRQRKPVS
jgi:hypothetical protein